MSSFTFIDLFAGCGGFSLGLRAAGGKDLLAVEKSPMAAMTYYHNFLKRFECHENPRILKSHWNDLLHQSNKRLKAQSSSEVRLIVDDIWKVLEDKDLLKTIKDQQPDVVVGGPPCQGFSLAGLRKGKEDQRNQLVHAFRKFIVATEPKMIVMENVQGIRLRFDEGGNSPIEEVIKFFEDGEGKKGEPIYKVQRLELNAKHYGVPQNRPRVVLIGVRQDLAEDIEFLPRFLFSGTDSAELMPEIKEETYTVEEALLGLPLESGVEGAETKRKRTNQYIRSLAGLQGDDDLTPCPKREKIANHTFRDHHPHTRKRFGLYQQLAKLESDWINEEWLNSKVFEQLQEEKNAPHPFGNKDSNPFEMLRKMLTGPTKRLVTVKIFEGGEKEQKIKTADELEVVMKELLTSKQTQRVLKSGQEAPTMLTIPDDYVHPEDPRTLTVREIARLQSFPDKFEFVGKETTGGDNRKSEVPQYTQVGNAVPPLLAKAIGLKVKQILKRLGK